MPDKCEVCPIRVFMSDVIERKTEVIKLNAEIIAKQNKIIKALMIKQQLQINFNPN